MERKSIFDIKKPKVVRGKFYKKTEVDALLSEIRTKAELENTRGELLQLKLDAVNEKIAAIEAEDRKNSILPDMLHQDAQEEADRIIREAGEQSRKITEEYAAKQEEAVIKAGETFTQLKAQYEESIEAISDAWQSFLKNLQIEDTNG